MTEKDPYFEARQTSQSRTSATAPADFFKPRAEQQIGLPESVDMDEDLFELPEPVAGETSYFKAWTLSLASVFLVWIGYDLYQFMQQLIQQNPILAVGFGLLLLLLLTLSLHQIWISWRNRRQRKRIDKLRHQAETMRDDFSQRQAKPWLAELSTLYAGTQHAASIQRIQTTLPDYLHDSEVIDTVDQQFFQQLDKQAMRLIQQESVNSAVLVAVSQLAIIDTLLVVWKTLKMVNRINLIYGAKLGKLARWRMNLQICKVALVSYGTQAGLTLMAEKTSLGLSGKLVGSVAQGIGVGLYQARIGMSAMQQIRPIPFAENALPKNRFLANIAQSCLSRLRRQAPEA
ncbi:putative membrane protein [Methylophaga frappieri]|uniref:Putative membrane protein n=1 Tax=Methylophaga frappieri (strain ATCC BAA-2434 / DSM 25690 / JAM7) TaxID=754477 RepID=I1YH36_METFJ|nr:TIGR01620 family protein [Methylophaga frappieri]AFJ02229.1 putative membrane protein [Methylophaga frappieri]